MLSNSNIARVFRGDFLKFWTGQLISNFGDNFFYMGLMAIILYRMNLGAEYLGLFMVMMAVPALIFGPIAGVYVDRWNRKHVMIVSDIIRGFIVLSLILYAELWYIYASMFMLMTVSRFFYPAQSALIPHIVDEDVLMSANAFSQTTYMLSTVLGPALGAAMVGLFGINSVFLFDGISFFISALFILSMRFDGRIEHKEEKKGMWKEVRDGLRFARRNQTIFAIMLYAFVMNMMLAGSNPLYMIYIRDVLHLQLFHLGILESNMALASLIASIIIGSIGKAMSKRFLIMGASFGLGFAMVSLFAYPHTFMAFESMAFMGLSMVMFSTPLSTLMQESTPDNIRGRVFGAFGAIMQIASLISLGLLPTLAGIFGVGPVMVSLGISSVIFTSAYFSVRKNREIFR